MRTIGIVMMMAAVALAGCADGASKSQDADEERFDDIELESDDQTGVIRGVVVDPSVTPVAGATVTIENTGDSTITTEAGAFGFSGLAPGSYFLTVDKVGFEAVQTSADVQAGVDKPPIIKVQIIPNPAEVPYVIPFSYTGYLSCAFKAYWYVFDSFYCDPAGTGAFGEDDANIFMPLDAAPDYYQSEVQWESTQALGDGLVTIQWACVEEGGCNSNSGNGNRLCNVRGPSPLTCWGNRTMGAEDSGEGIEGTRLGQDGRGLWVQMYSHCAACHPDGWGVGVAIQQTFDLYNHVFYNFEPEEDWSFLEDGPPAVPDS